MAETSEMVERFGIVPTAETLQRINAGEHLVGWLMPHLSGTPDDKETALTLVLAHMREQYIEGIADARQVAEKVAATKPSSRDLQVLARALRELEARSRERPVVDLAQSPLAG